MVNRETCKQSSSTEAMNFWARLCDTGYNNYVIAWHVGDRNVGTGPGVLWELSVMMLGEDSWVNRRVDVFV